jgi:hypothetical protein
MCVYFWLIKLNFTTRSEPFSGIRSIFRANPMTFAYIWGMQNIQHANMCSLHITTFTNAFTVLWNILDTKPSTCACILAQSRAVCTSTIPGPGAACIRFDGKLRMCVCVYIYIYICMRVCVYIYILSYICVCVCVCMYVYICIHFQLEYTFFVWAHVD